ncbi:hypothetical protein [Nonomuraea sp. NPDC050310]|uniref:hypothetical protein n=1 Tax=unclassified Nonomuraea TaxID=2593643 RepID=UPI0033CB2C58
MRWVLTGVLGLAALALAAAVLVMGLDLRRLDQAEAAGKEALAAARAVAPDLLSYNYRTIEQDLERAAEHTTGELTKHYRELRNGPFAGQRRAEQKVQQTTVVRAAVERAGPDRVEVLVFVDMGIATGGRQEFRQNRARLVMVREDARWLVAELSTLIGKA